MENSPFEKSKAFAIAEGIEYVSHAVVTKSLIRKMTGDVSVLAFDSGEVLIVKISPYGTLIQVIEGKAEVLIDGISNHLENGQSILIPAHSHITLKAIERFKMLSTVIKSGYEEVA